VKNHIAVTLNEEAQAILERHINLGKEKAVSYLPINTIEKVLGLKIEDYKSLIECRGHECAVFSADSCCIKSGAVFAYSRDDLDAILKNHCNVLSKNEWPVSPTGFVQRIASEWLDDDNPILPIVKKAFGEA
jgi:hypothetical protein